MTCMIAWPTWLVWLIGFLYYFYFILFYLITSFLNHISWLFGHEETGRHLFGRRINRIFFKKRFCFQKDSTYIISMGESVIKGKKIRKESRLQKEGMRGFSSSRFGGFSGEDWYIYVREEREEGILLIVRGGKVQKSRKNEIVARNLPGTLLVLFFLFFLVFPFTFHSRFSGCFREVILVDWSGHWGPLIYVVESKFPSSLLCYDCVLDFLDSFCK